MTDTCNLLSNTTLQDNLALRGGRRTLALDPIEAPSEIIELTEDLSQATLDLRELPLEQGDQLMEFATRHDCSLTARSGELQECPMRDASR
jgi:hypothetical protein